MTSELELLIIILDDLNRLPVLLQEMYRAGVPGITLLDSIGGFRAHSWLEDIGLSGLARLFHVNELKRRTLLAVMPVDMIEQAVAVAEAAIGGFGKPNSGILFTVPVSRAMGLQKELAAAPFPESAAAADRDPGGILIHDIATSLPDELVLVHRDDALDAVARALLHSPTAHVAVVLSASEHFVGLISLPSLADRVFLDVLPEIFFGKVSDRDEAVALARLSAVRTAGDAMIEAVAVHNDDTLQTAFRLMHEHQLTALPVVDGENRVLRMLTLHDLLAVTLQPRDER